ncbi:hypothetical protein LBMAG42_40710 [Deltaproteobacteria bacterium]|nr:hypothetical protein LBMAG42_40710 [Deltaproteobacteria bacterium]
MSTPIPPNPYEYSGVNTGYPAEIVQEGSFKLGVALGVIFGLWGVIGTLIMARAETKRGARYGFLGRLVATIFFAVVMVLVAD